MAKPCDAYYGTGEEWPGGIGLCVRPEGHPAYQVDRIGHSAEPVQGDEEVTK